MTMARLDQKWRPSNQHHRIWHKIADMRLYAGTTRDFVADATRNTIARRLENAFLSYFRYRPSPGEVRSWEESLSRLSMIVEAVEKPSRIRN